MLLAYKDKLREIPFILASASPRRREILGGMLPEVREYGHHAHPLLNPSARAAKSG